MEAKLLTPKCRYSPGGRSGGQLRLWGAAGASVGATVATTATAARTEATAVGTEVLRSDTFYPIVTIRAACNAVVWGGGAAATGAAGGGGGTA